MAGSETKVTAEQAVDAITKSRGLIAPAARMLKVSRQTFYNYIKRWKTVRDAYEAAREETIDFAEGKLLQAVEAGNVTATIFLLKTVGSGRGYVERREIEAVVEETDSLSEWRKENKRHRSEIEDMDDPYREGEEEPEE
jgi:hypothetical protein